MLNRHKRGRIQLDSNLFCGDSSCIILKSGAKPGSNTMIQCGLAGLKTTQSRTQNPSELCLLRAALIASTCYVNPLIHCQQHLVTVPAMLEARQGDVQCLSSSVVCILLNANEHMASVTLGSQMKLYVSSLISE